jgi:calcineurin-like phosphoesterase family protein
MATYWTSDLHYHHKKICSFTNRPWKQEDNEAALTRLWNNQVGEDDVVWHLGDFSFANPSRSGQTLIMDVLTSLNGKIHIILGNHDDERLWRRIQEEMPDKVLTVDRMLEINIGEGKGKKKLVMNHYPMMSWNKAHWGSLHVFGHHHGSIHHPGKAVDVGLDGSYERLGEWRFWTEDDILSYLDKKPVWVPDGDHHKGDEQCE